MAVLFWLPSARKLAECRVPRNRILCKYPNQIHILKFNCFIRKFYLRGKARRELRHCLRRVLQTPPSLPELPPIFNLFPLKKPSARRKHWKKKATGVGSGLVPVPVSTSSAVSVSVSVSISLSSPQPGLGTASWQFASCACVRWSDCRVSAWAATVIGWFGLLAISSSAQGVARPPYFHLSQLPSSPRRAGENLNPHVESD